MGVAMRWIIPLSSLVVGLCVGLGVGVGLAPRVVVRDSVPSALAPSMTEARFLACSSEAQANEFSEAEWASLWVSWRLRHAWPEWGTP
jgi:hypothetical protein